MNKKTLEQLQTLELLKDMHELDIHLVKILNDIQLELTKRQEYKEKKKMLKQNSYNMLELDNIGDSFNKFSKDWIKK
jgi:hypothetical protein